MDQHRYHCFHFNATCLMSSDLAFFWCKTGMGAETSTLSMHMRSWSHITRESRTNLKAAEVSHLPTGSNSCVSLATILA